jgi:hypothetical protein
MKEYLPSVEIKLLTDTACITGRHIIFNNLNEFIVMKNLELNIENVFPFISKENLTDMKSLPVTISGICISGPEKGQISLAGLTCLQPYH